MGVTAATLAYRCQESHSKYPENRGRPQTQRRTLSKIKRLGLHRKGSELMKKEKVTCNIVKHVGWGAMATS